jgi:hypothetical protein
MRWALLVLLLARLFEPSALGAQLFPAPRVVMVDTGARVRIGVTERVRHSPRELRPEPVEGIVRAIASDTLHLRLSTTGNAVAIPRGRIQGVEMSLGPPSRWASAGELGMSGAVLGVLVMTSSWGTRSRPVWQAGVVGAAAGFGAGAVVGVVHPYERWRIAWLPE